MYFQEIITIYVYKNIKLKKRRVRWILVTSVLEYFDFNLAEEILQ